MIRKPAVENLPSSFFRVTAEYTVIETGEEITFDYVVNCGGIVSHYSYKTPSVIYSANPTMQYMATQDGAAIGIKSPGALCDQTYFEFVPDDFRPFLMWFPDVQDMSFSWGYATELAYESPNAKVEFRGATLAPATQDEWEQNRAKLLADYDQIGALPGPWGHSFSRSPTELIENTYLVGDKMGLAEACIGYTRLELEPWLIDELFASAPADTGRYWIMDGVELGFTETRLRKGDVSFNGRTFKDHYRSGQGTVQREPGGTISTNFRYDALADVYPVLPIRQSMEAKGFDLKTPPDEYFRTALVDPDWNGFSACSTLGDPTENPAMRLSFFEREKFEMANKEVGRTNPYDPSALEKNHWLDFNEDRIGLNEERVSAIPRIIDREGYIYLNIGWGIHKIS